jgi:CheY-like chemotaxis protein
MATILIIEDERTLRMLYEEEISDMGHQVRLAKNGREALEAIEKDPPDLIITDMMMPVMDGLETIEKKQAHNPHIPVIINSAFADFGRDARSWSAEEYVVKSADLTQLKNAIRRALSQWPYPVEHQA